MKRWYCVVCHHGILAPKSLAITDTRKWCLSCSSKSSVRGENTMVRRFRAGSLALAMKKAEHEAAKEAGRARAKERAAAREVLKVIVDQGLRVAKPKRILCGASAAHSVPTNRGTMCTRTAGHQGTHRGRDPLDNRLVVWK